MTDLVLSACYQRMINTYKLPPDRASEQLESIMNHIRKLANARDNTNPKAKYPSRAETGDPYET